MKELSEKRNNLLFVYLTRTENLANLNHSEYVKIETARVVLLKVSCSILCILLSVLLLVDFSRETLLKPNNRNLCW